MRRIYRSNCKKDFEKILEYYQMCEKHGAEAVDDYMEFNDTLDDFEVIAKRFACKEPTAVNGIAKKSFLPRGRSCFAVARHIINECYDLERTMGNLANYFDYEAFGRELFMWDYNMEAYRLGALLAKKR